MLKYIFELKSKNKNDKKKAFIELTYKINWIQCTQLKLQLFYKFVLS